MPVTPPSVLPFILSAAPTLQGPAWYQLATAISIAVVGWSVMPGNVTLAGSVTGMAGSGQVTGKFLLPPVPLPVNSAVASSGMLGPSSIQVSTAVGIGVGNAYSSLCTYVGTSTGAIGSDVSKVVTSNPATLVALLNAAMASQGIIGPSSKLLSVGLGTGVAAMFLTGSGTGVSSGPAGPIPGVGVSTSFLL